MNQVLYNKSLPLTSPAHAGDFFCTVVLPNRLKTRIFVVVLHNV